MEEDGKRFPLKASNDDDDDDDDEEKKIAARQPAIFFISVGSAMRSIGFNATLLPGCDK